MNFEKAKYCMENLRKLSRQYQVLGVANEVLNCPKFQVCSGSSHPNVHHYGDYGLIIHTNEVVNACLDMTYGTFEYYNINRKELFLAALFHDYGKTFDYYNLNGQWKSKEHKYKIHHISRSAIYWNQAAVGLPREFIDNVTHCILSHHGQKEWGSPVQPRTREAWILHLCDNMSARLNDIDTIYKDRT